MFPTSSLVPAWASLFHRSRTPAFLPSFLAPYAVLKKEKENVKEKDNVNEKENGNEKVLRSR